MAFKTKEEMFGDGGPFGPAVPYSIANPPGHGAGNRGLAFGEQLTASIGNRTHYALCLNDEDLNTRLAPFETDGLDAAYRLGAAAVPGGGRVITLDGAAVETQSALTSLYADDPVNAHFRANFRGDSINGSLGFDAVAGVNDSTGFLHRDPYVSVSGNTVVSVGNGAILNPTGGASVRTIRLTGGSKFHTAGDTSLALNVDLIEILSGSHAGLYIVTALVGPTNTDAQVTKIDGSNPTFTLDAATTITVYRPRFGTWGGYSSRLAYKSTFVSSLSDSGSAGALALMAGSVGVISQDPDQPLKALRLLHRGINGVLAEYTFIDTYGRLDSNIRANALLSDDALYRGAYLTRVDKSSASVGSGELAHLVESGNENATQRFDYLATRPILLDPVVSGYDASIAFTTSVTAGRLSILNAALASGWVRPTPVGGALVEILTPTSLAGLYILVYGDDTGNPSNVYVRGLDGVAPAWAGGLTGTLRIYAFSAMGSFKDLPYVDFDGVAGTISASSIVSTRGDDAVGVGLHLPCPQVGALGGNHWPLLVTGPTSNTHNEIKALAGIRANGEVHGEDVIVHDGDFEYYAVREVTVHQDVGVGHANAGDWTRQGNSWRSEVNSATLFFSLNLPRGAKLLEVVVLLTPGAARSAGNQMQIRVRKGSFNITPGSESVASSTLATVDDGGVAVLTALSSGALSDTVSASERFFVEVDAGSTGGTAKDYVFAVAARFNDPGPRNY